jgi:hypothetical protein
MRKSRSNDKQTDLSFLPRGKTFACQAGSILPAVGVKTLTAYFLEKMENAGTEPG